MEDCIIFFLHHKKDEVTNHHLHLMIKNNPKFKVVPLTPSSSPKSQIWSYENMWMHNDTMIYDWMDSSEFIKSKRYCWFDWDTRCEQPVDEYFGDSWDAGMAGTNLHATSFDANWQWFNHAKQKNELLRIWSDLRGISPFCGMIASMEALNVSVERLKKDSELWKHQMNELRLPTCAHLSGIDLATVDRNSIQAFGRGGVVNGDIRHPVKIIGDNGMKKIQEFREVFVVSPAFSTTEEITRDLNASREICGGWDVHFIGRGLSMKSYIDSKVIALKKIVDMNEGMFDWLIVMDSNDTLFVRPFGNEVRKLLDSFGKPIIFSGEANCYPLKELNGLYTSKSKIRYLNSGCMAVRRDFIGKLLDHILKLFHEFPQYSTIGFNPPGDQTYYQLCLFSKELGEHIIVDDQALLSVSTALLPDSCFKTDDGLVFEGSRPYILHCQGNDKHARKREFMKKLGIPVRG